MKKIIVLMLILIFTVIMTGICFAETIEYIDDSPVAKSGDLQNIGDTTTLAQTGGIPGELFYAGGAICLVAGFFVSKKRHKES